MLTDTEYVILISLIILRNGRELVVGFGALPSRVEMTVDTAEKS